MKFLAILQATVCGELEEDAGVESSDQGGDEDEDNCDQDGGVCDYDVDGNGDDNNLYICYTMLMRILSVCHKR